MSHKSGGCSLPRRAAIWISVFASVAAISSARESLLAQAAGSKGASAAPQGMPIIDATRDSLRRFMPAWPERDGSCYLYRDYIVIAWDPPKQEGPVAIVRRRDPSGETRTPDCSPDSQPGDYVVYNEWAEYFAGMWGDLLLIDSGTSDIRSLYFYDVPSGEKVLSLEGVGGTEGWIDSVTVRIWLLSATDMPRSLCPDIHEGFGVGVDSLFALNLETLSLKALGPWRCNQLQ